MRTWRYIADDGVTASFGLAADEFLMRLAARGAGTTLRLYTYRPHVALVGRFQNIHAELRLDECRRLDAEVNRRLTGGGAIIMGDQQLGLALTTSLLESAAPQRPAEMFEHYAGGVIEGLRELGIAATFRAKNDIEVDGRKLAGLGICLDEDAALLFHTSILVDLDVPLMLRLLNLTPEKISDKDIASFEERLVTVCRILGREVSATEVREAVRRGYERALGVRLAPEPFSAAEVAAIERLEAERYRTTEWIYQRSPAPDAVGVSLCKTEAGLLRVYVSLVGEVLKSVLVTGDFFSTTRALLDLEARLKWGRAEREHVAQVVAEVWRTTGSAQEAPIFGLPPEVLTDAVMAAVADAAKRVTSPSP